MNLRHMGGKAVPRAAAVYDRQLKTCQIFGHVLMQYFAEFKRIIIGILTTSSLSGPTKSQFCGFFLPLDYDYRNKV